MKKPILALLSILAVVASVGWKLSSHSQISTGLNEISLIENSEHSQPGPALALRGFRIRLSPSDFGYEILATGNTVPEISVITE